MQLEVKKYLFDVQQSIKLLSEFTDGKDFAEYQRDAMLRAAVERRFEIIGEAFSKLSKLDRGIVEGISEYKRIIAFRNILIHGYADVDDQLVWDVIETKLPLLRTQVDKLLQES